MEESMSTDDAFSEPDHVVLKYAREEALRLGHAYVGTEHQLLGLLRTGDVEVGRVLEASGITPDVLRSTLEAALPDRPAGPQLLGSNLPYTSRARKVIVLAQLQARSSDGSKVTCLHFLEAVLREEKNVAAHVLHQLGIPGPARLDPLASLAERLERAGLRWQQ